MNTASRFIPAALAALVLSSPVAAQEWYGQIFGSYADLSDETASLNNSGASVRSTFDDGYGLGIAFGREISSWSNDNIGVRAELELSYTRSSVSSVDFSGNGAGAEGNPGGSVDGTRIFGNIFADFKQAGRFTPYVGAGVGVAFVDQNIIYGGAPVTITGDDSALSAQLIAGGSYDLQNNISLFADVRYIRDFDVEGTRRSPALVSRTINDFDNVTVNFGLRYAF
ncbi:MAG: outer membrane beta-barrel protein [Arenibacterium sp.]